MRLFSKYCSLYKSQDALTTIVDCWVVLQCVQNLSACEEKKKKGTMATFMKNINIPKCTEKPPTPNQVIHAATFSPRPPDSRLCSLRRRCGREALSNSSHSSSNLLRHSQTSAKNYPNVSLLPHGNHVITTVRQAAPNVHWRGRLAKAYPVL